MKSADASPTFLSEGPKSVPLPFEPWQDAQLFEKRSRPWEISPPDEADDPAEVARDGLP
jgi:hypothetical protein